MVLGSQLNAAPEPPRTQGGGILALWHVEELAARSRRVALFSPEWRVVRDQLAQQR